MSPEFRLQPQAFAFQKLLLQTDGMFVNPIYFDDGLVLVFQCLYFLPLEMVFLSPATLASIPSRRRMAKGFIFAQMGNP